MPRRHRNQRQPPN